MTMEEIAESLLRNVRLRLSDPQATICLSYGPTHREPFWATAFPWRRPSIQASGTSFEQAADRLLERIADAEREAVEQARATLARYGAAA